MKKKKQLSARAVWLLRKVQEALRENPKLYNQNYDRINPECGSPSCICGWLRFIQRGTKSKKLLIGFGNGIFTIAQFDRLYLADKWPGKFRREGSEWENIKPYTAIKRIDVFIASDGTK